jgi:hypothetical protein
MKFVPDSVGRSVAGLVLRGRKNSPTILFGAGIVSMVGSTVLACRATLKLEDVIDTMDNDLTAAKNVRESHPEQYSENDRKGDVAIIYTRSMTKIARLYAPSIVLGGVGVACLTKSQSILKDRNAALTAAYIALDSAFERYRNRVIAKHGEEADRHFRYGAEEVSIIDEETGKVTSTVRADINELPSGYARWFDDENNNFHRPPYDEYNWVFLRGQQNWANDLLRARGHLFLNEVYSLLGMQHTSAGAIVGWLYDRDNEIGDNYVDFGCWGEDDGQPLDFFNGREFGILLDFNVDGPIWDLLDARRDGP